MTCEEGVLAIEGNRADQVLVPLPGRRIRRMLLRGGVAIDLDAAVGEEGLEPMPTVGDVGELFAEAGLCGDMATLI